MKALLYPNRLGMLKAAALAAACPILINALSAYESYHAPPPAADDTGYCSSCHPGFTGGRSDTLHALHTGGSDPVTTNCDLCHTGSGRNNPLTMWSTGDADNGLGCAGCHGRDYGKSVGADYTAPVAITGLAKNSGVGLRRHHINIGIVLCGTCHDDPDPYPENVINPGLGNTVHYYFRGDVSLGGKPVDPSVNEDTANDADTTGLDNDGDDLYDANDPDSILDPTMVIIQTKQDGGLLLQWPTPSPLYGLQSNVGLDPVDWVDMPSLTFTQRANGFWFQSVDPPLDDRQFYRLLSNPVPALKVTSNPPSAKTKAVRSRRE